MTARRVTVRAGRLSRRVDLRVVAVLGLLVLAAAVVLTLEVGRGEYPIAPLEVVRTLAGGGDEASRFIVVDLRLPRALTALLAGIALGVAGAIFQDVARNPLVAPDLIGVTTGASLAAVSLIVFGGDGAGGLSVPLAALGGALATGAALYLLAWRDGVQGYRLVLIGIGLAALLQAGVAYVLTRGRIFEVQQAYVWLVGSLSNRGWEHVRPLLAAVALLVPLGPVLARHLAALQLGDDLARALGVPVERSRLAVTAVAIVLTGLAVAATGPVAFVAFVAPHVARRLGRTAAPSAVLPLAGVFGALLVLTADVAGRELLAPTEIPVGIVTAILAAPYFLLLLARSGRTGATT